MLNSQTLHTEFYYGFAESVDCSVDAWAYELALDELHMYCMGGEL